MEETKKTRIALLGIIIDNMESVPKMNSIISQYGEYVVGRMGIPYKEKGLHIISLVLDAPDDVISAVSGKIGMLSGISTKTVYSRIPK